MTISILKLTFATLLPVIVAIIFYLLDKKTKFGQIKGIVKQIIYGVVFGGLAIFGTEWGIPMNGAQVNVRDAAVLVAGLFFGAPAGLIAGTIGAVERAVAITWGVGTFTVVACSVSTFIAGVYAALLRKFMFENKKPGIFIAFAVGIVMEVFHLTMVFVTNINQPIKAIGVVEACTLPMLLANGLAVLVTDIALVLLSKEKAVFSFKSELKGQLRITQTIQRWMLITVIGAFIITSVFLYFLQDRLALQETKSSIDAAITSVENVIAEEDDKSEIAGIAENISISSTGYFLILDENLNIVGYPKNFDIDPEKTEDFMQYNYNPGEMFEGVIGGENCYMEYRITQNGYYVVAVLPEKEAMQERNISLYVNTFLEVLVFAALFGLIYVLIKKVVVNQIEDINGSLAKITGGNLEEIVNVRSNVEFASLSDDINSTVGTLKHYISEASARIDAELEFAKSIQESALPRIFPAFPKRKDLDIYATMDPAKEVGGDFYDFYITGQDRLNFLIADVSGKGIPAAMFMMRAKTELKSLTETDMPIADVFTTGNRALCEGNDAGMFVTAWQGGIDLTTGKVEYANAGHNPPLVKHKDGKFEYLRSRAGFVLAGMDGVRYKSQELQLKPGDIVYLYTDGVTEATNANTELFGEDRLLEAINAKEFENMEELCKFVKSKVDEFVGEAPQFDDITMVAFKYIGDPTIEVEDAKIDDIPRITEFVEGELEKIDCPMKAMTQIDIALDEILSNIVKYAYPNGNAFVEVKVIARDNPKSVYVRFMDRGIPYNPLTNADPDVTLSAEERGIGGLGIYLVKKTMDDMKYKYENGQNILTIQKIIG
ncbi:MAG: SpoIIE family protein phosphatase [Clostridia bacterium]|nr:SpoIIE family protein phosphatase [Clostridia bacterium]